MYIPVEMQEKSAKNLFREKKTTDKVPSTIFRGFEDGKMVR